MTNLDGGLFRIKLSFSPRFPEEHPRAKFETQLFHHRIAADGTPCYTREDDLRIRSHISRQSSRHWRKNTHHMTRERWLVLKLRSYSGDLRKIRSSITGSSGEQFSAPPSKSFEYLIPYFRLFAPHHPTIHQILLTKSGSSP